MCYSILIVDDEEIIRQGIRARLAYLGFEFRVIKEADDGEVALKLLAEEPIDIVMTDIKMRDMDGIDLIRQAKPQYPEIQFIILSGYSEFTYAEQAVNLGVNAYLLKPLSNEQLKKTMEQVLEQIVKREANQQTLRLGERILKENQQFILEKNLNTLLNQQSPLKEEGLLLAQEIACVLPIQHRKLLVVVINVDGDSYEGQRFGYQDIEMIHFCIKNIVNEISTESAKLVVSHLANSNQLLGVLSHECAMTLRAEAEQLFSLLQGTLWNQMQISISIGVSSIRESLSLEGTKEAIEAFGQRLIHGNGNIYFYDDIKLLTARSFPACELQMLGQYIERQDVGNIQFMINTIFSDEQIQKYNVNYIRMMWVRIIGILLRATNVSVEKEMAKAEQLVVDLEALLAMASLTELRTYLYTLILDSLEADCTVDTNSKNKIQLAIKYITNHYNQDIAINDLAERFTMSPNYFSSMFKKETGQTTLNYIKEIRLQKAKKYLVESEKSVVDIAKEVGYEDSQYFFKVFKKATGQTPLQYRRDHTKL
ncbi:MAG: response regulator transcription factor [Cellulosilyticaceae bacterium]